MRHRSRPQAAPDRPRRALDPATARRALLTALAAVGIAGAACADATGPRFEDRVDFARAKAKWVRAGLADYEFVLLRTCFCEFTGEVRVTVRGGVVESVVPLAPEVTIPPQAIAGYPSLDDLIEIVERAITMPAGSVAVRYDPAHGFPTRIEIDWFADAVDDEVRYEVSGFAGPVP